MYLWAGYIEEVEESEDKGELQRSSEISETTSVRNAMRCFPLRWMMQQLPVGGVGLWSGGSNSLMPDKVLSSPRVVVQVAVAAGRR